MKRVPSRTGNAAGACTVSKTDFINSFSDVPATTVHSISDVKSKIDQALPILTKSTEDWTKRNNQLKIIRSLIIHSEGVVDRSQLLQQLLRLNDALEMSVKDLRSQVLREAAITCSFIVEKFGNDAHAIGETVFNAAMAQTAVSTKIMATSGATLSLFVAQYIQTKQIFTAIASYSTSKDKNLRRQVAHLIETVVAHWSDQRKNPFMRQICELIKAAINDADSETRIAGRKAFAKLDELHPTEAEKVFQSVDASKQKMLRAADAASSNASISSERSLPMRSKLSAGAMRPAPNISAKFLAQRSASAIDTKQITRPMTGSVMTPGSKYARPATVRTTLNKVDTSPGGSKFTRPAAFGMGPRTSSNLRPKTVSTNSQPGSRNASPPRRGSTTGREIQREKSNLANSAFFTSLPHSEQLKLQKAVNEAQYQLRQPSRNEDDEFLLPKRQIVKSPPKSTMDLSKVDAVLRACASSSATEKKEGIKALVDVCIDPNLSDVELKNIGNTINRLLSDISAASVLDAVSAYVQTHHSRLSDWLKLGLHKIFTRKATETLPNMKKQIVAVLELILASFDRNHQLNTVCELIIDPIRLLNPKGRLAMLDYLNDLLCKHMERGSSFNTKQMNSAMRKIFAWMTDQKNGQMLAPICEKVICSLFSVNAADFSSLFNDFDADYRDLAYRILQAHGHSEHQNHVAPKHAVEQNVANEEECVRTNISQTTAQIADFVGQANRRMGNVLGAVQRSNIVSPPHQKLASLGPLRPINSQNGEDDYGLNESFDRLKINSTMHLAEDTTEQAAFVQEKITKMTEASTPAEQNEGIAAMYNMLCEGSFTLWEQNFAKLLLAVFEVLSKGKSVSNKKLALRVLTKMCTAQAARLFDSTEMAMCKVLDAAVHSKDDTVIVAADDCLKTLATHLPLAKVVNVAKLILNEEPMDDTRMVLILKMLTRLFEGLPADELAPVVDEIAPCAIRAYDAPTSSVRKSAVYCLVAMVNKVGNKLMEKHLQRLTGNKLNLIQVYVSRAMSSSSHSHV
ncbi:unnamed protein product [Caenorhabditis bovis]|uniref:TOG domain-containing protein n=1 Tax=Caenorhabditis bovis TaxID=2654633 RepID=A0A8S1EQW2_9PELO|nr:unnamed protein product [Caenorhabditis bovis]